jgi:hypothetical protein
MSSTSQFPYPYRPDGVPSRASRGEAYTAGLAAAVGILAGSALIGLAGGFAWAQLAPRVAYVTVGGGSADVVNAETTAFIAGDAWYCLIGLIGGVIIGVAGYLLAVRRLGPVPMAGILAGSVAAGYVARWIGENEGTSGFNRELLNSRPGTVLHAPLALGAQGAIAFWPLAACLAAGGLLFAVALRERAAARRQPAADGTAADGTAAGGTVASGGPADDGMGTAGPAG